MRQYIRMGLFAVILGSMLLTVPLYPARVGQKLWSVKVRDANDKPRWIPSIGKKVVTIFYTDPDVADQNDAFADKLKAVKYPKKYYRGVGIANLKDTWKPNSIIRAVVRKKIAKYKSTILTDPSYLVRYSWGLGKCDGKSVIIVIGIDKKVKYLKKGRMSSGEIKKAMKIIEAEIALAKAK